MIGKRVSNFEIRQLIGEGGMGAVYEAEHLMMKRRVAIKVLKRELAVDEILVKRFLNEARAASTIRHPNIIEVIDLGILQDGVPYIIMEMLEGESLARRLARTGPLELTTALDFTMQAAGALEAAHMEGIVHRDLKPDNLYLVADPRISAHELVKVLDFGIAKLRGDLSSGAVNTNAGAVLGTPIYMSPEQCRALPGGIDHRTDIYSLGIILYEILCGAPPFVHPGLGDLIMMHMSVAPEPPSQRRAGLPPQVEQVILKALAKRPEDRFSSMADLVSALASSMSLPLPSTPLTNAPRPTPSSVKIDSAPTLDGADVFKAEAPRPRRSLVVGGILTVGLAAVAGAALLSMGHGPKPPQPSIHVETPVTAVSPVEPATEHVAQPEPPTSASHAPPGPANVHHAAHVTIAKPEGVGKPPTSSPAPVPEPSVGAAGPGADNGFLSLDSSPWANVFLGGRLLGATPLIRVPLPPGKHVLTLKNPELGRTTSYVVEVKPGSAVSRFVGWDKE